MVIEGAGPDQLVGAKGFHGHVYLGAFVARGFQKVAHHLGAEVIAINRLQGLCQLGPPSLAGFGGFVQQGAFFVGLTVLHQGFMDTNGGTLVGGNSV